MAHSSHGENYRTHLFNSVAFAEERERETPKPSFCLHIQCKGLQTCLLAAYSTSSVKKKKKKSTTQRLDPPNMSKTKECDVYEISSRPTQHPCLTQERPISAPLTKSRSVLKSVSYILFEPLEPITCWNQQV